MSNISFKAQLNINPNVYTKIPKGTPEGYIEDFICQYREFVENPKIDKLLADDIIEIRSGKQVGGYSLELNFINSNTKEQIKGGIFTNQKVPNISVSSFISQTCEYIGKKFGIKPKFLETASSYPIRALKEACKTANK